MVDAHNVKICGLNLEHFYYYLVPQNKRAVALLGNDFLRYCEYTHKIEGNIYITKIDMDAYKRYYDSAISVDELAELIDEATLGNEIDGFDILDGFENRQ